MISKDRLMKTMLDLVAVPGISGTESEGLIANKIYALISEIPYFKLNKDKLRLHRLENDQFKRSFVSALYTSGENTKRTIIISGHMDVVDVEEYGHLKPYAFDPVELTKRIAELSLDEDAAADLSSGEWIFGRGVADMKYGIGLAIELLRELSLEDRLEGNLLFLAVPGEESNSEGMLEAVKYLADLQENQGYEFTALLMPECYLQKNAKDKTRYIHVGACGKIMPMFYFAGKETHTCEPFNGLDPILLAAEVNKLLSLNADFCDYKRGVSTPPPICLKQMDLKTLYSVQTPLAAVSYYNVVTLGSSVRELTVMLENICIEAFSNVLRDITAKYERYGKKFGTKLDRFVASPCVITYSELYESVRKLYGEEFDRYIKGRLSEWDNEGLDNQTKAINIVKETYERYPNKAPMIILSFIPPYYPDFYPDEASKDTKSLFKAIDGIIEYAETEFGEPFAQEDYYMGVSDLSYTGLNDSRSIEEVYRNMPGADSFYTLPVEGLKALHIPGMILGAYGKDMHKYTERLNVPFAFEVLPSIYEYAIHSMFTAG